MFLSELLPPPLERIPQVHGSPIVAPVSDKSSCLRRGFLNGRGSTSNSSSASNNILRSSGSPTGTSVLAGFQETIWVNMKNLNSASFSSTLSNALENDFEFRDMLLMIGSSPEKTVPALMNSKRLRDLYKEFWSVVSSQACSDECSKFHSDVFEAAEVFDDPDIVALTDAICKGRLLDAAVVEGMDPQLSVKLIKLIKAGFLNVKLI